SPNWSPRWTAPPGSPSPRRERPSWPEARRRARCPPPYATLSGLWPGPGARSPAIADRLGFVAGPVRDVLRAAALLGTDFAVSDLAIVLGRGVPDLIPAVDEACAAGVLAEAGQRLGFRHPLIRAALYDDMPAALRAAWHRDAAHALAESGAPPDRLARHMLEAL